jgi:hypothetical protein
MVRIKRVNSGDWRTLEWFFGGGGTAFLQLPVGAHIKVRYGVGWFGKDRQVQRLDGQIRKLQVGLWSATRARMQIKVPTTVDVAYDVYPGDTTISSPKFEF